MNIGKKGVEGGEIPRITVMGIGGAGCNALDHIVTAGLPGATLIATNTDARSLEHSLCPTKLQLGQKGLGAGSQPEVGRREAMASADALRQALSGCNLLLLVAGMGGGTGTGATPVIAQIAREMGIITIAVVFAPFEFENRGPIARRGIERLEVQSHALIVMDNHAWLKRYSDDTTFGDAFRDADEEVRSIIRAISDVVTTPALINIDFPVLQTLFGNAGHVVVGSAEGSGSNRATEAAELASSPQTALGAALPKANCLLVTVTASDTLRLFEVRYAVRAIRAHARPDAYVVFGTVTDPDLGDRLRLNVFAISRGGRPLRA